MNIDKIKKINFILILTIFIIIIFYAFENSYRTYLKEGMPIPHFEVRDLNNKIFTEKNFIGKVLVINFWASWCPPCIEEFPSLIELKNKFSDKDFELLLINVGEPYNSIKDFLNKNNYTVEVYRDINQEVSKTFGTFKYPESYIVDKKGIIRKKVIGQINWQEDMAVNFIKSLLQEN